MISRHIHFDLQFHMSYNRNAFMKWLDITEIVIYI